jgi:phosphoribosylformimino-5-aminoimidazole carboxamide ribotide isomerase
MIIIPAIDIIDNQVVRLEKGIETEKTVYSTSVEKLSQIYIKHNFNRIHLVNLSSALSDGSKSRISKDFLKNLSSFNLQVGGGLREKSDFDYYLENGVNSFVLSTMLYEDIEQVKYLIKNQIKIIAALDVNIETVYIKGWKVSTNENVFDAISKFKELGIKEYLITDISKDGMLEGYNLALYKKIKEQFPEIKIIASGGCSELNDLHLLNEFSCDAAVVGKAFLDGRIIYSDVMGGRI